MNLPAGWKYCIDVNPAGWIFPPGKSWIAGWLRLPGGNAITDVRAWLDHQPFFGLHGLPRHGEPRPPYSGFSFLLAPGNAPKLLRIEASDLTGRWVEFFRTPIKVSPDPIPPLPRASAAGSLPELIPSLLRRAARQPELSLAAIADDLVTAMAAEPLNAFPNPPFVGAP